ncbi:hypothetical protein [Streptomyces lydicus]|uniref:hypothetical protein n=1 Tax=Streptomyces lydicus TaxID=47763 RepID=UPI0037A7B380
MSSTYYILCVSHDPATTVTECPSPEAAEAQIGSGIDGHYDCDLMIERVSGGPVEIGCPPTKTGSTHAHCHHADTEWVDVEWLRLLGGAYNSTDPRLADAVQKGRFFCWTPQRLHRLRHSLGNATGPRG